MGRLTTPRILPVHQGDVNPHSHLHHTPQSRSISWTLHTSQIRSRHCPAALCAASAKSAPELA